MTYDEACRLLEPTLEFLETLRKRAEPRTYTDAEIDPVVAGQPSTVTLTATLTDGTTTAPATFEVPSGSIRQTSAWALSRPSLQTGSAQSEPISSPSRAFGCGSSAALQREEAPWAPLSSTLSRHCSHNDY